MNRRDQAKKMSLLLTAALVFSGCGTEADSVSGTASSAIAVKAVTAELGTLTVSNQFVGTVSPQQQVSIIPLVSGEVDAVYAEVGDVVEAGDVLFHIKDDAARLQMENAELSKQGAELSAQMQLGSAQVMNNISMQTNIRSLEYQLEMAKDQYKSAVDGIADAEDAKEEMNSAIDEINHSVKKLQEDQKEMEEVVSTASKYVTINNGKWEYKAVYNRPQDPDHYTWEQSIFPTNPDSVETETDDTEEDETHTDEAVKNDGDDTGDGTTATTVIERVDSPLKSAGFSNYEEHFEEIEGIGAEGVDIDQEENAAAEKEDDAKEFSGLKNEDDAAAEEESYTEDDATSAMDSGAYAYFSIERVQEEMTLYLADADDVTDTSYVPSLTKTKAEAWEAYYEQQKIDSARKAAEKMGYSAEDIGSGKAQAEILENSAQIVMLQYQASQLESNQATVDSSIKSAESARDTTEKTIDFYEDNLENAQITYGISNGQAYQDTAGALATQIQAADVGVRSAQLQLEYYSPTTPISGTVVSKTVEQYGLVQAGYAAYVISNQDAMNVTFAVSEQVRETLQIGMTVTLEKSGSVYTGTITEIGETVDQQSGGLFLLKAVTEADGEKLASGTTVKLTVDTYRAENAVLIPYDAVHFESEQAYVFAIVDHKAVRTPVTVGLMSDEMVEITDGLAADSQVVATWSSQLEDGADLRIIGESQSTTDGRTPGTQDDAETQSDVETQNGAATQSDVETQNGAAAQEEAEASGTESGEAQE